MSSTTRGNLRPLEKLERPLIDSPSFDYMNTKPLPGYEVPTVYNYFQANPGKLSKGDGLQKKLNFPSRHLPSLVTDVVPTQGHFLRYPAPSTISNDPRSFNEDMSTHLNPQHQNRIVQNVTNYIKFFCGQLNHLYSLPDIEDLIEYPVKLALDLVEKNKDIWELIDHITICCKAAKIKPIQWFDILTQWKTKFQRSLSFSEFSVGLSRLFEEVNGQPFTEEEVEKLFHFFLRNPLEYSKAGISSDLRLRCIRRRDFQVGFKKQSLSRKRIEWFNHQAHILFKCYSFLNKINLSFRDLNVDIVRSKYKKQSINGMELECMISVMIHDYIIFVNCNNVDKILAKEEREKRKKEKIMERKKLVEEELKRRNEESKKKRRTLEGSEGTIEIYDDSEDDGLVSFTTEHSPDDNEEVHSVTSQLDIGDDISTLSVMDDISEASSSARSSSNSISNTKRGQLVTVSKAITRNHGKRLEPLNLKLLQTSLSDEDIMIDPSENSVLTAAEVEHLERLAANLKFGHSGKLSVIEEDNVASRSSNSNELSRSRSIDTSHESFMEERQKKSSALVRSHSILRRYSQHRSSSGDPLDDPMISTHQQPASQQTQGGSSSPALKSVSSNHNLKKKNSSFNLANAGSVAATNMLAGQTGGGSRNSSESIIPKEVVNDWYLRDEEFKNAQRQDPTLTPNAYQNEYQAFESAMHDKRTKQMQYYKAITDHFDARVTQARKRLARARKTGI